MQSMNFEFLKPENAYLANLAALAEAVLHIDPGSALTRMRSFAEELTKAIYEEERLPRLPKATFYELVKNPVFRDCVDASLIHQINYLRVLGNDPAHGAMGELRNAQLSMGTGHQLASYMAVKYYGKNKDDITPFTDIPDPSAKLQQLNKSVSAYEKDLKKQQEELDRVVAELEKERIKHAADNQQPNDDGKAHRKQQSEAVADSLQWSEAKTRTLLIDAMLLQANWDVGNKEAVGEEVEVAFPNNPSGKGYVDYVLWGDNGQPLAVVEAKNRVTPAFTQVVSKLDCMHKR